ncbi:hypothetical protein KIN20_006246 [Parelaphostrongylus tenuis]|uniref:Protein kinase domain-containing protein n=1 Tax=Parelaphostrongylus tenuis TaxID=148309 RepID=A0AAD5M4G8_PARTN|nr:hypothetical protein KIN20_006246 [Parelaphostrongylus tenuis]
MRNDERLFDLSGAAEQSEGGNDKSQYDETGCSRQETVMTDENALKEVMQDMPEANKDAIESKNATYEVFEILGRGSFGAVFRVNRLQDNKELAMKCESCRAKKQILKHEGKVFKCLSKLSSPHFISLEDRGQVSGRFIFLIMKLVGKNLWDLRLEIPNRKFSMATSIRAAEQTVAGIRDLHTCGYIHRDIKPANFVIGRGQDDNPHTIYIIDFGLSRRYRTADKDLRSQRERVAFRGTTRYASINALEMKEQSRKDDIESWWYMVLEWMIGNLPWQHYKGCDRDEVAQRKKELREPGNLMTLLKDTPQTYMARIILYIDTLEYASIPDYNHIAAQLNASMQAYQLDYDDPPDWDTTVAYMGPRYEYDPSYVMKFSSSRIYPCTVEATTNFSHSRSEYFFIDQSPSMEYLLDKYFFHILPFGVTPETRKAVGQSTLNVIQWADWFCKYESPLKLFQNNPYFVLAEAVFVFLCLLTFLHAYRHGGRHLYLWIGLTVFAFTSEFLSVSIPELSISWHAQGVLSFFGMRVPLYALLGTHQTFGYIAYVLVSRMHLPWWAEGPGVGVSSFMLLLPYRIVGTKLLWWTWHGSDPTLSDRLYGTPWSLFCSYTACTCLFVWILHLLRSIFLEKEYDWTKFPREFLCAFSAGVLCFWSGAVLHSLLYHPLYTLLGVPPRITAVLLLFLFAMVVFSQDRKNLKIEARMGSRFWFDELACAIVLEYLFLGVLVIVAEPLNVVSEGLHQPIGPCGEMEDVRTLGLVLRREKNLCTTKYDGKYFDFHCVPNGIPKEKDDGLGNVLPLEFYPVCGTAMNERAEYIWVIWGFCTLFGYALYQMAACSGSTPVDPIKIRGRATRKSSTSNGSSLYERKAPEHERNAHNPIVPAKVKKTQ